MCREIRVNFCILWVRWIKFKSFNLNKIFFFINKDMLIRVSVYYSLLIILHLSRVKTFKIILHIEQIISQNCVLWIYHFDNSKKSQMFIGGFASIVCGFWRQWEKEGENTAAAFVVWTSNYCLFLHSNWCTPLQWSTRCRD